MAIPMFAGPASPQVAPDAIPDKVVRAVRIDSQPVIDGLLDDPAWERADVITGFHQSRPGDPTAPSERTEVYLLYDDDALYIGA